MNLQICGLSKSFGKNKALQKISIDFDAKVYGLLGENGSGKTTFMRCLARIYMTDSESVLWDQAPLTEAREKDYLKSVGYLPQHFGLYKSLSLYDALSTVYFAKGLAADKRETSILEAARLVNLTDKLQTKISALSGGMLRRAGIAQALLGEPSLLMFDEPTTGLDPEERLRFKNLISDIKGGKTILLSTHIVEDVEAVCDRILVLHKGRLLGDFSQEELRSKAEGKVYQIDAEEEALLVPTFWVVKKFLHKGRVALRVLSQNNQRAEKIGAGIEDGYFYLLKQMEDEAH